MKFYGLKVYDIADSIVASGLPMLKKEYTEREWNREVQNLEAQLFAYDKIFIDCKKSKEERDRIIGDGYKRALNHLRRACNLGGATPSSGHDCAMKGILVNVNIKADQSFWLQWERYHHQDTVSSMSTMHCITKFDIDYNLFSRYTDQRVLDILKEKIEEYNNDPTSENFHKVIHNCPEGIELTRRVSTNYLQIKTMRNQRKSHKMYSWSEDFIRLCDSLPHFNNFCGI